jgi:diaminopropionate ammonia-lyase
VVFLPRSASEARAGAIASHGAEVRRVAGSYDDALREAARAAEAEGWLLVSDKSWPGYTETPREVMQGYRLMADEAIDQWTGEPPTHVFIQGGVGGAAAAVSVQLRARLAPPPALIVVEPDRAACLLASAELGGPMVIPGEPETIMGGLACSEPSLLAWQELERAACAFMAIPDEAAVASLKLLAGFGVVSGESGVAGLAALLLAAADGAAREAIELGRESRVLLFSTEGASDPATHRGWGSAAGGAASRTGLNKAAVNRS